MPAARSAALAVLLITLITFVSGLCPSPYWLDSSEFAAAAVLLGVAHPPGHPLALLLGKAASLLPLGPLALRVGAAQAVCAALAAALLVFVGVRIAVRTAVALGACADELPAWPLALAAAGAALCTSLGYAVAFQAVRPEVYALHRLLAVVALLGLLRHDEGDHRGLLLCGLAGGLGLTNHHFLTLLFLVPLPLVLRGPGLFRAVIASALLGLAALLLYAYLPLRAAQHPLINWGAPDSPERLLWVISARAFQKSVREPTGEDADVFGALVEQVGLVGIVLALGGLYLLCRQQSTRRLGAFLVAVVLLHAGGRAVLGFDVANPDAHGYLVPAGDALALAGCAAFGGLLRLLLWLRRPGAALPAGVGLLLAGLLWGVREPQRIDRSDFWDLDTLIGSWLEDAPPRARLLSANFQTVFGLWYLMGVEGRRPDVEHWHPHFLAYPGYREDLLRRFPLVADLPDLLGERALRVAPLLRSARRRPTLFEYDLDTPPELAKHLVPLGLAEAVGTAIAREPLEWTQQRRRAVYERLNLEEPETRRTLLWRSFVHAALACQQGDRTTYEVEVKRARALLRGGTSRELDDMDQRCHQNP
ncbi:MAG: DUF2723 domain-containing protein [Myxococcales bacterium]|nr:DUF2723 domain-containing protein [Myxococcota bacterium]MDW8281324.1 DUF2723 domain-containing protein [Myxococcales bacterium]